MFILPIRPEMIDLMFSCRVQSKRVEHAFIGWLLHRYKDAGFDKLTAVYKKTPKNIPGGKVFTELGFIERRAENDKFLYEFDLANEIPWDGLVAVEYEGQAWEP